MQQLLSIVRFHKAALLNLGIYTIVKLTFLHEIDTESDKKIVIFSSCKAGKKVLYYLLTKRNKSEAAWEPCRK